MLWLRSQFLLGLRGKQPVSSVSPIPLNILQGPQARQLVSVTSPRGAQGESCALRGVLLQGRGVMRSSAGRFQGPHKQGLPTQDP